LKFILKKSELIGLGEFCDIFVTRVRSVSSDRFGYRKLMREINPDRAWLYITKRVGISSIYIGYHAPTSVPAPDKAMANKPRMIAGE
jgi:hypothetical protein